MTPTTIEDFRPERIHGVLQRDDWAIISAHIPAPDFVSPGVWKAALRDRTMCLGDKIRTLGYTPWFVTGRYDGVTEESFLVLGISREDARALGRMFGQVCVLVGGGLLDCSGRYIEPYNKAVGIEVIQTEHPIDDYTRVHATRVAFRVVTESMQLGSARLMEAA